VISSVLEDHRGDGRTRARVAIEPALSALRHGRDTRIFQEKSAAQILEEVLSTGLAPYGRELRVETRRAYPPREFTVQYQESDFDFAHRLMEEEGILYFFDQEGGAEILVLIDDPSQHPAMRSATGPLLEYSGTEGDEATAEKEHMRAFHPISQRRATALRSRHFDWTHPSVIVEAEGPAGGETELPHGARHGPEREAYVHDEPLTPHAYGGTYGAHDEAAQARIRRERQERDARLYEGRSTSIALAPGHRFDLMSHPRLELNASYVVIEVVEHLLAHVGLSEAPEAGRYRYLNQVRCLDAEVPWRPPRERPRPRIHGVQTAIVVGPPGEEVACDEHGRVKVHFHWDRLNGFDPSSSCWIRVMQSWAGKGWGTFVLPRIGMEVVVSFIDGDPDRPLITGCVYNADNPPPYGPASKNISAFKTNSSLGGGGYNELRFDDSKESEEIYLQGQKDWNTLIKHDHHRDVGHSESQTVAVDRSRSVGNDEAITVGVDRSKSVGNDESVQIGNDLRVQIGNNRSATVVNDDALNVGNNQSVSVAADRSLNVGAGLSVQVGESRSVMVGQNETVTVALAQALTAGVAQAFSAGASQALSAGATINLTAGSKITFTCGASSMTLDSGGKVTISGTEFDFSASGHVQVNGSVIDLN
jgi:type VI secretion system secreted protein VgrG